VVFRRSAFVVLVTIALALMVFTGPASAANDPSLKWKTLETPHFRVSFYSGEAELAQHIAELAEDIHARLSPVMGWAPATKVEIALFDQTDSANGLTSGLPYNHISLYMTAPDDLSPLGEYDDWYQELFTHEYTHTLHIDNIRGIPALVNAILGRTLAPNQAQARWILEGLAVYQESARTTGGRLRSSQWQMYMRTDILENNVAHLDEFSNTPRRWPQGNIWYLYGSFFMKWIAETYGDQAIRTMISHYGSQLIPLGINRSIRRATGRTYEELYPAWIATLRRDYEAQAASIRKQGLREGVQITHGGNTAQHPQFTPANAWPDHIGDLLYIRDDGHTTGGLYTVPLIRDANGVVIGSDEKKKELVIRTNGAAHPSFAPDGSVIFDSVDYTNNLFPFTELFSMKAGEKDSSGLGGNRTRLTTGFRATDPDVSPDGRRVVFATNHRGTRYLQIADITPTGVTNVRALVKSNPLEQVFAPAWSPDNRHVAYSVWTRGGYRDIRYVDTFDGTYVEVTHDRAIDGGPNFSADGKWLYFHSDRTKVMNIYAWEVATGKTKQVTNVMNGAYQPSISRDNKTLLYLGYTHLGFDIFAMKVDPATWTDAEPWVDDRPPPNPEPEHRVFPVRDYDPFETLRPRRYSLQITPGNYGQAFILSTTGADIAGHHAFAASMAVEAEHPELQFDLSYSYGRLPVDLSMRAYRLISPRGGYALGQNYKPTWAMENIGVQTGVSYAMPGPFAGQSFSLTYSASRMAGELPVPTDKLDPYETPTIPVRGTVGTLNLGWGYSNVQRFLWSVGPEKGFSVSANMDVTHPALASDFEGFAAEVGFTGYALMPWLSHHSMAFHAEAGTASANIPGRGPFYVGGFVDVPLYDTIRNLLIQGGVALRGYPAVIEAGRNMTLFNVEYRFPIVNIDRGLSTLPIFLQRISGNLFVDYGSAFNDAATAKFKTGTGAELWFDATLGYVLGFNFRLGYARGWASGGLDKIYFVAAVPF
jgi:hypothetical protein